MSEELTLAELQLVHAVECFRDTRPSDNSRAEANQFKRSSVSGYFF